MMKSPNLTARAITAVLACVGVALPALAREPLPMPESDRDSANPRNVQWQWPVIEWIGIGPRPHVGELGDRPTAPTTQAAFLEIAVRNAGDQPARELTIRGITAKPIRLPELEPGEHHVMNVELPTRDIPYGRTITLAAGDEQDAEVLDTLDMYGPGAHRVLILTGPETEADNIERFGSMTRRLRHSFDDLHTLFDGGTVAGFPPNGGEADRPVAQDRFRIEGVVPYDPEAGMPELFRSHPEFDLVIAMNEGGPLCCFFLNDGNDRDFYSIGHNFRADVGGQVHGLWSRWGEQALWHETIHYRGVPDFYIYNIDAQQLPGRSADGWRLGDTERTEAFARDIMNDTYHTPEISALTTTIINSKEGASRIGACENPSHRFGHMWRWVPERLTVEVRDENGDVLDGVVRAFASTPAGARDARRQMVAEGATPEFADEGSVTLSGDYMNAGKPRIERSIWKLIEAEHRGERRWTIITLLEINQRYAAGERERAEFTLRWPEMEPVLQD